MKKMTLLVFLVVCIVAGGTAAGLVATSDTQDKLQLPQPMAIAGLADEAITVVGDGGMGIKVFPMVAQRDGEARMLDAVGRWSLERMGYSDLVFPCESRAEAITLDYLLPSDAAQGPERWYVLHVDMDIWFSKDCREGEVEVVPATNGASAERLIFRTSRRHGSLRVQWGKCNLPEEMRSARSSTVSASFSTDLCDAVHDTVGVKPGANSLTFAVSQRGDARVEAVRIRGSSGIEVIPLGGWESVKVLMALPEEEASKALTIAMNDPKVQQLIKLGEYVITAVAPWELGPAEGNARVDLVFKVPHQIRFDWPWPPPPIGGGPISGNFWVRGISIAIDLKREVVTGISPSLQFWGQRVEGTQDGPTIPELSDDEKALAKKIALADSRVQELIAGKSYCVAQRCDDVVPDTQIGVWHTSGDLTKIGAGLFMWFDEPFLMEYDWPTIGYYDEQKHAYPHYVETTYRRQCVVEALEILVDLREGTVVSIKPVEPLKWGLAVPGNS